MKFEEYRDNLRPKYSEFANALAFILDKAIEGKSRCPKPQQIQSRAKTAESLEPKLIERNLRTCESIEDQIKDLAGIRPIFYTNLDADRFLATHLIYDNFDVCDATIHHPTDQNGKQEYRAIHYIVCLKPARIALPEYVKFAGMKCEIQVQTTLNHAWSETSHDMMYKAKVTPGFGTAAQKDIERRLKNVMNKYLLPAGYEIQQIQYDHERLQEGRILFDRGTLETLAACQDNNERRVVLETIKQHVFNYDDPKGIYPELSDALIKAIDVARTTEAKPIESTFGQLTGTKSETIETTVLGIFEVLRYVDVRITFKSLCTLYKSAISDEQRRQILKIVDRLANYEIEVWQRAGTYVQEELLVAIREMTPDDKDALLPLITTVCKQTLDPELHGRTWSGNTVLIRRGAVIATDQLKAVRKLAIDELEERYSQAKIIQDKECVLSAMMSAARLPGFGEVTPDMCAMVLVDFNRIVEIETAQIEGQPYELLESIEEDLQRNYWHACGIAEAPDDRFRCRELAGVVQASILTFRDILNADANFVRFKALVGFKGQFERDWEIDELWDTDSYRKKQADKFVASITDANEREWTDFIETCAAVRSNDMATFPIFVYFIGELAKKKPDFALRLARGANENVQRFFPTLLIGLKQSVTQTQYNTLTEELLAAGQNLDSLARHQRFVENPSIALLTRVFDMALKIQDDIAVMECLIVCFSQPQPENREILSSVMEPALRHVIAKKQTQWLSEVYLQQNMQPFYEALSLEQSKLLVDSLLPLRCINYETETILLRVGEFHPDLVWSFFERRLVYRPEGEDWYEAIPYVLHDLKQELAKDAFVAVDNLRHWYNSADPMFRYEGGRMLCALYPLMNDQLAQKLAELAASGDEEDVNFTFELLANYYFDEKIHPVLKALVCRLPKNDERLNQIHNGFVKTGVVEGPYGVVGAYQTRRSELLAWRDDIDLKIKAFAEIAIKQLDTSITYEQLAADKQVELRKLRSENSVLSEDDASGDDILPAS